MARRRLLGCLPLAALVVCSLTACKDKGSDKAAVATAGSAADLDKRCVQLAKLCADKDKHVEKMAEECKQASKKHVESGCAAKAIAVYDCYEKQVCASVDKVWTMEDLRVLADRSSKCLSERNAIRECAEPAAGSGSGSGSAH